MEYTREQKQAMCSDRNISVMANAGSGKTFILIDRYIDIILNDERVDRDPRKILAITFTKNAAGEMKARATKKIEALIKAEKNEKHLKALYKIRERLSYANISTIHSFCSSLLRDYPIEAGILPNFSDVDDAERIKVQNEAISLTIDEMLLNSNPEDKLEFQTLIIKYGYNKIADYLSQLLSNRELMLGLEKFYSQSREEIIQNYIDTYIDMVLSVMNKFLDKALDTSIYFVAEKNMMDYENAIKDLQKLQPKLDEIKTLESLWKTNIALEVILKTKIKGNSTINSNIKKACDAEKNSIHAEYVSINKVMVVYKDFGLYAKDIVSDSFMFYKLARIALEKSAELKAEANGIDFDDMLFLARDILQVPEIAAAVQKKYVHVLIDEFQDTNDLQYDIAKALVPSLAGNMNTDVIAFIVGDAKQSIYGFRNADVRVFKKAIEDISKMNQELISTGKLATELSVSDSVRFMADKELIKTESDHEYLGKLKLTASFRLKPAVAGFVNTIMQPLMDKVDTEYDVKYDALVYGRETEFYLEELAKLKADQEGKKEIDKSFGSISILTYVKPYESKQADSATEDTENGNSQDDEQSEMLEAAKIAEYIDYIVSDGSGFTVGDREPKQATWGDISILARSRTKFPALIKTLIQSRIPFVVHSGSGFYAAPEIADTIEFLKFLHNQGDDLALISILRSPYFAFDINELYTISMEEGLSWFEKLTNYAGKQSGGKANKFIRAVRILAELQFYAVKVTIAALLGKIYETGGWISYSAGTNTEKQTIANLEKLTALSRAFESKGFRTLYDFVEYLEILRENSSEAEAVTVTGSNAVNILTIHASKGQEYPIVFLYNTNSRNSDRSNLKIDDKYGITFKAMGVLDGDGGDGELPALPLYLAKKRTAEAETAEEKRILYVAMTRAKDHLILTASLRVKKPEKDAAIGEIGQLSGYFEDILDSIPLDKNIFHAKNYIHKLNIELPVYSSDKPMPMIFELPIYINPLVTGKGVTSEIKQDNIENRSDDRFEKMEVLEGFNSGEFMDELFSASKLLSYDEHPDDYEKKYILGFNKFNQQNNIFSIDPLNQIEETHGMEVGSVIHQIFENINEWLDDDCQIKRNEFDAIVRKKLIIAEKKTDGLLLERINNECAAVAATKLMLSSRKALASAIAEKNMMIPVGTFFLQGAIDVIIQGFDGNYEVWDWKSNKIETRADIERWKKHYQLQMEIYIYLLSFLYPDYDTYRARLLFTNAATVNAENEVWTVLFEYKKEELVQIKEKIDVLIKKANFMGMLGL